MEPQSLICARLVSRTPDRQLDTELLRSRVRSALSMRERHFDQPFYRLLYGDSDGLSGFVADRFGDYLVVQPNTAGADRYCERLMEVLVEELEPAGILLRRDSRSRQEMGLPLGTEVVHGDVPERVQITENACQFLVPLRSGQKTGWFYDHRDSRARLSALCRGRTVLDVYSYGGAWGVQAACAGATSVLCVDNSEPALTLAMDNARLNGVEAALSAHRGRADQVLREMADRGQTFDVVVLDPPAFVQRRRDLGKGKKAYQRINELALRVLSPGGLLVSASCSMHLSEQELLEAVGRAAARTGRSVRITGIGGQAADHPVHPMVPETRYLKTVFAELTA
jgi:23S rRNA (cytosine1962-C5)-methyltransferase